MADMGNTVNEMRSGGFQCRWTHPLQGHGELLPHGLLHDRVLWREREDYHGQSHFTEQINNVLRDVTTKPLH